MADPSDDDDNSKPAAPAPRGLDAIAAAARRAQDGGGVAGRPLDPRDRQRAAPTHLWSPEFCGALDIRIDRNGLWWYLGTPIGREPLVRLFASVLTKEADDRHYLVTPAEKIEIQVDDVAFIVVDYEPAEDADGPLLLLVTNVGDKLALSAARGLRLQIDAETEEATPYAPVRGLLEARIDRKTFYRLVDLSSFETRDGADGAPERVFGFRSGGAFHALAVGAAAERLERALKE